MPGGAAEQCTFHRHRGLSATRFTAGVHGDMRGMRARMLLASLTVVLAVSLCAPASAADLVDVRRYAESIQVACATPPQTTSPGRAGRYCQARRWSAPRARALPGPARARRQGLGLKVRRLPPGGVAGDGRCTAHGHQDLLEDGYIAAKSNNNLGSTVDSRWSAATAAARHGHRLRRLHTPRNTTRARDRVLRNRLVLKNAMENQAFRQLLPRVVALRL